MSFLDSRNTAPADSGVVVVPSDTASFQQLSRSIYVGTSGSLVVTMADGKDVSFSNVPAGTFLHVRASKVKATGTSAGSIVALW